MNYTKTWTKSYGDLLLKRAKGKLPEMESSKIVAKKIKNIVKENDKIFDVGCGLGHYYISLKKRIKINFEYVGMDIINDYIDRAKILFRKNKNVSFKKGNIYHIPFKNNSFEIVMCNNFLHNLPSVEKPIKELLRVTKKYLLIRALVFDRSFRIQEVKNSVWDPNSKVRVDKEFKANGEPVEYSFFNIYSKSYLESIIYKYCPNASCAFTTDVLFNPESINRSAKREGKLANATTVVGKYQVYGCMLMPWKFIEIKKA